MESKPLIFIDTPKDMRRSKPQGGFDTRNQSSISKDLLKKISNIATLNKKGKKIKCLITTTQGDIKGLIKDVDQTSLLIDDKKVKLNELLKVEIVNI